MARSSILQLRMSILPLHRPGVVVVEVAVVDVAVTVEDVCGQVWHMKGHNNATTGPINGCSQ